MQEYYTINLGLLESLIDYYKPSHHLFIKIFLINPSIIIGAYYNLF